MTNNLFSLYSNFVIVFIVFSALIFMISPNYNFLLVTIVLGLAYSEYFLYNYMNKLKFKKVILQAFLAFYVFSVIYCAIKTKTFFQEIPFIILFALIFFSIKTYFEFFQSFQNFNKVFLFYSHKK